MTKAGRVARSASDALAKHQAYGWAIADQAVSSAGNLLLMSQLSRSMGSNSFGRIASVYAVVMIGVAVVRALFTEVINSAIADEQQRKSADRHARILTFMLVALTLTVGIIAIGLRGSDVAALLLCTLPLLLIQDRLRFEWIYRGKTKNAFLMDGLWLVTQCTLLAVVAPSLLSPSSTQAVVAWGVGAISSTVIAHRIGGPYHLGASLHWGRKMLGASSALAMQSLVVNVAAYGPLFIFAVLGYADWSAGYLAASSILGIQAATLVAIRPLIYRNFALMTEGISLERIAKISIVVATLSLTIGALGIAVLALFGTKIYGATAHLALVISVWIAITRSIGSVCSVLNGVLRSTSSWSATLTGEVVSVVVAFTLMIGFGEAFGPRLISPAQTIAAVCSLMVWVTLVARIRRNQTPYPLIDEEQQK